MSCENLKEDENGDWHDVEELEEENSENTTNHQYEIVTMTMDTNEEHTTNKKDGKLEENTIAS